MIWLEKDFESLTNNELYEVLKARIDVFVVEQTCYYPDIDDKDRAEGTVHLMAYEGGELMAYLRALAPGVSYEGKASLGRVLTTEAARGKGAGHELLRRGIALCQQHWPGIDIKISAQQHLKGYYGAQGFEQVSDMYLEDDIPHIAMLRAGESVI